MSNDIKLHASFQTKLNPIEICTRIFVTLYRVNLRTRLCFKNNARRVLRSPSARAGNAMAKRKRTKNWSTNHYTENYHFPHSDIFFHKKQKSDFYFLDINKISNFASNFYHKFLVDICRAGLMIFLHLSCQFILFL